MWHKILSHIQVVSKLYRFMCYYYYYYCYRSCDTFYSILCIYCGKVLIQTSIYNRNWTKRCLHDAFNENVKIFSQGPTTNHTQCHTLCFRFFTEFASESEHSKLFTTNEIWFTIFYLFQHYSWCRMPVGFILYPFFFSRSTSGIWFNLTRSICCNCCSCHHFVCHHYLLYIFK